MTTTQDLNLGDIYGSQGALWKVIEKEQMPGGTFRVRGEIVDGDGLGNTFDWYSRPEYVVNLVHAAEVDNDLAVDNYRNEHVAQCERLFTVGLITGDELDAELTIAANRSDDYWREAIRDSFAAMAAYDG